MTLRQLIVCASPLVETRKIRDHLNAIDCFSLKNIIRVPFESMTFGIEQKIISGNIDKKIIDGEVQTKQIDATLQNKVLSVDIENKIKDIDNGCN